MKFISSVLLLVVTMSLSLSSFAAKDPKKNAIEARQGEMHIRAFNAGPLFAMAKGKMPYDAKKAQMMANNLKELLDVNNGAAWMQGTSNKEYPDDTTALPKIWNTWPKIADYGKKYGEAVNELAKVAGNGRGELGKAVKGLGKACKDCHDEFRKKDE